jgi:hypothetical protein
MADVVDIWTGRSANALRQAVRMTHEGFAAKLGTSVRGVAKWSAEPDVVPVTELQRALDTMLSQSTEDTKARFRMLQASPSHVATTAASTFAAPPDDLASDLKLDHDPSTADLLDWLDARAGWNAGTARSRVRATLKTKDEPRSRALARVRADVPRSEIAATLARFYDVSASDMITFSANVSGELQANTSIVTRPEWLDLRLVLGVGDDQLQLRPASRVPESLDGLVADAAVNRIAHMVAMGTRFANRPLYQLCQLEIGACRLSGEVALTDFTTYALTMDLLEHETLDAIVAGNPTTLPLRSRLLPTLDAVRDTGGRLCVGGPLALFAAARPGRRNRGGEPDYMLLVQQRSDQVINAARRLAVIPKSFHEPLIDFSDDAQLSATLERELEAELFGREDVDATIGMHRHAEPFHLTRLSEPMRWLIDHTDLGQWRMECTGFGFNLVSGNFEFASLIVIDDEEWWGRYGGHVEANWETHGLRRYSSRDRASLANLVHDEAWSNEGLFAFVQGLKRLGETGGERVVLPAITAEA